MSTVLCPNCGLPMVWMRNRWRCQCHTELVEERDGARLDLLAVVYLPESIPADSLQRWDVANRLLSEHGLRLMKNPLGTYHHAEHAITAWVELPRDRRPDLQLGYSHLLRLLWPDGGGDDLG